MENYSGKYQEIPQHTIYDTCIWWGAKNKISIGSTQMKCGKYMYMYSTKKQMAFDNK